jgi:hypothetical protein
MRVNRTVFRSEVSQPKTKSSRRRCKNKNRFLAEFWWKPDEDKHGWVFFDDHEGSESYGKGVTRCSGCGERLHRGMLTPA